MMRAKIGDVVIDKTYNIKGNLAIVVGEGISQPILVDHRGSITMDKLRDYYSLWDGLEVIGHIDFERIWEEAVRIADRKTEPQTDTHDIRTNTHECVKDTHDKDEPQTETEIAKAIVHKMIDDAVIAEDVYPDLRQKMHDAVERLDEYYPSEDERSE